MRVHVLTHSVVEADGPDIYAMVAEHVEAIRGMASLVSMAIHHGDLDTINDLPRVYVDETEVMGVLEESPDDLLDTVELRRLAASSIAAAQKIDELSSTRRQD